MKVALYILENKEGNFYIGQTNDLDRRLAQHNDTSKVSWAARRGPWELIHTEVFETRAAAVTKERALKSLKSKSKVKDYIVRAKLV